MLFTQDHDFLRLHASGSQHAGILYARQQTAIGEMIYGITLVVEGLDSEAMERHLEYS